MARNYGWTYACSKHPKRTARARLFDAGTSRNPKCPICRLPMERQFSSAGIAKWVRDRQPYRQKRA